MACMMKCWTLEERVGGGVGVGDKAVVSQGCKTTATSLFFHSYDYWHFTTRTCMYVCLLIKGHSLHPLHMCRITTVSVVDSFTLQAIPSNLADTAVI